eukprot:jgi/Pico_ML_1/55107/g855.t2
MVSAVDGTVAAQRHLSPPKASLVAGATVLSATGLVELLIGSPLASLEVGFFGAVAAAAGNVASRHFHAWKQRLEERGRFRLEEEAFDRTAEEISGRSKRDEDSMLEMEWLEWVGWHWRGRRDHLGYYRVLGLEEPEVVSQEDIKKAFHSAAKKWHPDMYTAEQTKEEASYQFKRIQRAYTVLRDPEKKAMYDAGRALDAAH